MKPTVSESSTLPKSLTSHCRVRVPSVEKSLFCTYTSALVSAFMRRDLPALVYPTRDTVGMSPRLLTSRSLRATTSSSLCLRSRMRRFAIRRSSSS